MVVGGLHMLLERVSLLIQENPKFSSRSLDQTFTGVPGIKLLKSWVVHSSSEITPGVTEWTSPEQLGGRCHNWVQHAKLGKQSAAKWQGSSSTNNAQRDVLRVLHFRK